MTKTPEELERDAYLSGCQELRDAWRAMGDLTNQADEAETSYKEEVGSLTTSCARLWTSSRRSALCVASQIRVSSTSWPMCWSHCRTRHLAEMTWANFFTTPSSR